MKHQIYSRIYIEGWNYNSMLTALDSQIHELELVDGV